MKKCFSCEPSMERKETCLKSRNHSFLSRRTSKVCLVMSIAMDKDVLFIRLGMSKKLCFILGFALALLCIRQDMLERLASWLRGYEYDYDEECVLMRKTGSKKVDYCRPLINCDMCKDVEAIDDVHVDLMSKEMFEDKYAHSGRPLVVRNASSHWPAMDTFTFEFFRELYLELDSPVLDNLDEDCQFFAWEFSEFSNMASVFSMSLSRVHQTSNTTRPWYIGWANCDSEAMAILQSHYRVPDFIGDSLMTHDWFFMGTEGYGAPFHIDRVKFGSWQAQITGEKQWRLKPPPECHFICNGIVETVLKPGDVIVVNTNWWMHATNVVKGLSITITNEYQ